MLPKVKKKLKKKKPKKNLYVLNCANVTAFNSHVSFMLKFWFSIDERSKVNPVVKSQMFVTTTDMAQRRRYDKVSVKKETNLEIVLEMVWPVRPLNTPKHVDGELFSLVSPMRKNGDNFLGCLTPLIKKHGSSHSATVDDDKGLAVSVRFLLSLWTVSFRIYY